MSIMGLFTSTFLAFTIFNHLLVINGDQLLMVNVVWRHGDRTPLASFPKDPNMDYWKERGFGKLTKLGAQQHQLFGLWMRNRYVEDLKFLPETYDSSLIYVRSTDYERTIDSAKNNMIGMYNHVPKIYIEKSKTNVMFQPTTACKRTIQLQEMVSRSQRWKRYASKKKSLLNQLSKLSGTTQTLNNVIRLEDTLYINKLKNMTVSSKLGSLFPQIEDIMNELNLMMYGYNMGTYEGNNFNIEIPRARGGILLKRFLDRMIDRINGTSDSTTRYFAYSAHDVNIISLLSTFGFKHYCYNRDSLPPYASFILIELWRRELDNVPYVKVYYRGDGGLYDLSGQIKGCPSSGCTLDEFYQRSLPYLMSNFNKFCSTKPHGY